MSRDAIRNKFKLTNPIHFLALGMGSGLSRFAPGTIGTIAAIPLYLLLSGLSPTYYFLAVLITCVGGIYICGKCAEDIGVHDHPAIVWDEFAGYFITMAFAPQGWEYVFSGFVLFRIFDILKPWPIGILDRKMRGGLGIMLDDIIAGLFSLLCLQLIIHWELI